MNCFQSIAGNGAHGQWSRSTLVAAQSAWKNGMPRLPGKRTRSVHPPRKWYTGMQSVVTLSHP